ncbi:MAG: RluA family pseudouridine synthase [Cyanobacteria bacterium]|nr:RluA family pseudouridine synthase [Cyanobacteriota bacterium]MDA1020336.1 RluA family pseudouridine synthase [Cyanobacteriota bacterium]
MKLIQYLKEKHDDLTNRSIKRALEAGACTVNGKIERYASVEIKPKDKVVFRNIETKAKPRLVIEDSRIIYQDDQVLVYNKDAGHAIMSTEKSNEANLTQELKKLYRYIEPVHRLDKQTSGLCLFAKDKKSLTELMRQFKDKEVKKQYEAIVDGHWKLEANGRIENEMEMARKIGAMQVWQVAKRASHKSKKAITEYQLIKNYKKYAHLALNPVTGRTHQLRVHMAHLGYPIVGDSVYAESFRSGLLIERHLLHAISLEFRQPLSKQRIKLTAPRPKELLELL